MGVLRFIGLGVVLVAVAVGSRLREGVTVPPSSFGLPATMRAAVYTQYGDPHDVVALRDVPVPSVGVKEVLVKVHAAAFNPVDYKIVGGLLSILPGVLKAAPPAATVVGMDLAGDVVAVGPGVTKFAVGQKVYGMQKALTTRGAGTVAEFSLAHEDLLNVIPEGLDYVEAASLPLVAQTNWESLENVGQLSSRENAKVLILGGSGGTGSNAIMMAKHLGASVTATCSTRNFEAVKGFGADEVVDYRTNLTEVLAGRGFDIVYDTVGGANHWELATSAGVMRSGGQYVTIVGDFAMHKATIPHLLQKGWHMGSRAVASLVAPHHKYALVSLSNPSYKLLDPVSAAVVAGGLRPVIDSVHSFEAAVDALQLQKEGHAVGKIVVDVAGDRVTQQ